MKKPFFYLVIFLLGFVGQAQTVLDFTYDTSGNQMLRKEGSVSRSSKAIISDSIANPETIFSQFSKETIENKFMVSPNPTAGEVTLRWDPMFNEQITNIELISLVTSQKTPIKQTRGNSLNIDLSGKVTGLYLVTFYLKNAPIGNVQKKIIKL